MDEKTKKDILIKARQWMKDELIPAHKSNTLKLASLKSFNVNPFLWTYLAYFLEGNKDFKTLAKVLIYPRALGSSINTSFGNRTQQLITRLFDGISGSTTPGIDIEFIDKLDGRKKYCQIKAGPNVINRDDVTTIKEHFRAVSNLARTNNLQLQTTDLVFCLLYGESEEKNAFIQQVEKDYTVLMGREFWYRFTGDPNFYNDLIAALEEVALGVNMKAEIDTVVDKLAIDIEKEYGSLIHNK